MGTTVSRRRRSHGSQLTGGGRVSRDTSTDDDEALLVRARLEGCM